MSTCLQQHAERAEGLRSAIGFCIGLIRMSPLQPQLVGGGSDRNQFLAPLVEIRMLATDFAGISEPSVIASHVAYRHKSSPTGELKRRTAIQQYTSVLFDLLAAGLKLLSAPRILQIAEYIRYHLRSAGLCLRDVSRP